MTLLPDIKTLRKLLDYNPETGVLTWKPRSASMFRDLKQTSEHSAARWNSRFAGRPAFTHKVKGYRAGRIFGRRHMAHRVAWAIFHGEWPSDFLDHENGNRSDNRIANLRIAGDAENGKNKCLLSRNTSGIMGVFWCARRRSWRAQIGIDGRRIHIGNFASFDSAVSARKAAEKEFGYHPNHGRSA